ncbi:Cytochrome c oxidase assembly factor 3 [Colletotrichum sidae]|uniref:Cytochrome c oxidase assembly factor 3 n=3 Tax=Colletotrichum orbiculare species complex TaxID=2707354 RepID=A0A4R8RAU1_COLTR|nr:Cytochrome c oxidase assembly factor 3 [Colletotrichum spinosum]TDZ53495.1 Cytochrome c oxidase assembly factor 3 [Colletotrichum trifolii]TEA15991.1 Cytochrome c oxidase assembly factor 3 [Colletotrichum sidae]
MSLEIPPAPGEWSDEHNSPKKSSYYDRNLRQGPALIRARKPYLAKNLAVGAGLWCFAGAVYWYTLRAVGQDEFEDVKVPDTPRQPAKSN